MQYHRTCLAVYKASPKHGDEESYPVTLNHNSVSQTTVGQNEKDKSQQELRSCGSYVANGNYPSHQKRPPISETNLAIDSPTKSQLSA